MKYPMPLIFITVFTLLWEFIIYIGNFPRWIMPAPSDILSTLPEQLPLLLMHGQYTLVAALIGFVVAIVVALLLAVAMNSWPWLRQGLYPLLVISQTVPIIAVAPLFIIWFGYGLLPKVVVVTLVCFFPVVVSVTQGLEAADRDMVNLLKTMGANKWGIIKEVRLPAALPSFFAGLKIAATYSVMGAVIGEWLGASKGLGVFMTRAMHSFQLARVFSAILIIALLSVFLFAIVEIIAHRVMPWHYKERE